MPVPAAAAASPAVEVSASAIERLRSSIPRPDKVVPEAEETRAAVAQRPAGCHHAEPPPQVEPVPRSAGAAAVETREPRLDFLFRPRQARQASHSRPPQQEAFEFTLAEAPGARRPARSAARSGARARARPPHAHPAPAVESRIRRRRRKSAAWRSSSPAWSTAWPIRSTPTARSRRSSRRERCASDRSPSCARTSRTTPSAADLQVPAAVAVLRPAPTLECAALAGLTIRSCAGTTLRRGLCAHSIGRPTIGERPIQNSQQLRAGDH